ncbi:MAG TPA: flagellar filament capping protein FliD, partial [Rhodoferax sp.]
ATTQLQMQLATATANLSTLGKFKASVTVAQASAKSLTTLTSSSTSDAVKKALTAFISDFNSMLAATKTAASDTSGVGTLSRGMTRAMTADFSRVDALRHMGFTKASDGTLKLDDAKFAAAFKNSSSSVQSPLAKLGQLVDKAATKELASDGRLSHSMSAFSSKSSTLQLQQSALLKAAQQYASFASSSTSSTLSAYQ